MYKEDRGRRKISQADLLKKQDKMLKNSSLLQNQLLKHYENKWLDGA